MSSIIISSVVLVVAVALFIGLAKPMTRRTPIIVWLSCSMFLGTVIGGSLISITMALPPNIQSTVVAVGTVVLALGYVACGVWSYLGIRKVKLARNAQK